MGNIIPPKKREKCISNPKKNKKKPINTNNRPIPKGKQEKNNKEKNINHLTVTPPYTLRIQSQTSHCFFVVAKGVRPLQRIPAEAKRTESRSSACVLEAGELVSAWPPGVDIVNWNYLFGHLFESQVFPYLWKRGGIVFIYVSMYVLKVDLLICFRFGIVMWEQVSMGWLLAVQGFDRVVRSSFVFSADYT